MATLEEIKALQDKLAKMIKTFEQEHEKKEENLSTVWVPQDDEIYFFINGDGVTSDILWDGSDYDTDRLGINNVFKTEEEAEGQIEWLKILYELRTLGGDYFKNVKKKSDVVYAITYDCEENGKTTPMATYWFSDLPLPAWFETKEQAEKAVKTIGEDRLKKYWFRVEE